MNKLMKVASIAMAAAMMFSSISFSASAVAKKAVDSKNVAKGVKINWKKTAKAGKYKVLRSTSKNGKYKVVGTTKKTAFVDKKAKSGKTYYYTVKTTNAKAKYQVEKAVRLTAPKLKSVVAEKTGNMVTLKWKKVKGAKSYGIYYATVKNGKAKKFQNLYSVTTTSETIILDKAGTYAFKVVAEKGTSKSAFSNVKTLDFVETPDVALSVGETDNTIVDTVALIESFAASMGMEIDVVATWEIADPTIISIGDDYVITGLAAGETTIDLTLSYELEGEPYSEKTTLSVVVKGDETPVVTTITEDEAIELVKKELSGDYTYFVEEELVEQNGSQYYVVCVNAYNGTNTTTVTKYLVKTDGTEVFDKYAADTTVITEEEAIELVKKELSGDYTYFVEEELVEQNGSQYYVVCVNAYNGTVSTTVTKYLVKIDGTEVFDKYAEDVTTITEDEAIELVKKEMGEDFSYIPAEELEVRDGSQYYVIYVKTATEGGSLTTVATYLVKIDGSEVFDKDAASAHIGEYFKTGEAGDTTFIVNADGTFEMTTLGVVNQTVLGTYEFGVTDDANVIKLVLHPNKSLVEDAGEEVEEEITGVEGTAIIKDGTLTLSMESQDTVFTKK